MNIHLQASEKKLVQIFIVGTILFLLIFEAIFLGSRYYIETQDHKNHFVQETNKMMERRYGSRGGIPSFVGIESIQTTLAGEIISSQIRDLTISNISEILNNDTLLKLSKNNHSLVSSE